MTIKNIKWIRLINPSSEDIKELGMQFPDIHPTVLEELYTPTIRPRVENFEQYLYLVLHFPSLVEGEKKTISQEVDFILLPDTLITVSYKDLEAIERFWHSCENPAMLQDRFAKSPAHLLYHLLQYFFHSMFKELDEIQRDIDIIEEKVFSGHQKEAVGDIALLKRIALDFRRAIKPQQLTLESLVHNGTALYGENVKPFLVDLTGDYLRVWNLLENHTETLDALYDTNNSLLATKINETMRVLTILAFVGLIPATLANIFSLNAPTPFANDPMGFWIIVGIISAITISIFSLLKWRKII